MELKTGVVDQRTKHVARHVLSVNTDQHRIVCLYFAHHHREVYVTIDHVFIRDRAKATVDRRQISLDYATDQHLFANAIAHQVRHSDHFKIVLRGELLELWQTRHRPILVHDLADHAGGIQTGNAGHVHAGFSLTGPNKDPAVLCAQGKDMTRTA